MRRRPGREAAEPGGGASGLIGIQDFSRWVQRSKDSRRWPERRLRLGHHRVAGVAGAVRAAWAPTPLRTSPAQDAGPKQGAQQRASVARRSEAANDGLANQRGETGGFTR